MTIKISEVILELMNGDSELTTAEIERHGMEEGFTQKQVLGGIGYLRRQGELIIVREVENPENGRREHRFRRL